MAPQFARLNNRCRRRAQRRGLRAPPIMRRDKRQARTQSLLARTRSAATDNHSGPLRRAFLSAPATLLLPNDATRTGTGRHHSAPLCEIAQINRAWRRVLGTTATLLEGAAAGSIRAVSSIGHAPFAGRS